MRLLRASDLILCEASGNNIPEYAILSHRWEDEEVTFQDLISGKGHLKAGWKKIAGSCAQAILDGWQYVVSCTSSAWELINFYVVD